MGQEQIYVDLVFATQQVIPQPADARTGINDNGSARIKRHFQTGCIAAVHDRFRSR
jgi:hypothetical protein